MAGGVWSVGERFADVIVVNRAAKCVRDRRPSHHFSTYRYSSGRRERCSRSVLRERGVYNLSDFLRIVWDLGSYRPTRSRCICDVSCSVFSPAAAGGRVVLLGAQQAEGVGAAGRRRAVGVGAVGGQDKGLRTATTSQTTLSHPLRCPEEKEEEQEGVTETAASWG